MIEKQSLFESRQGGYYNYRIPGLVTTPGGAVLAYCEARQHNGGDHDTIDIVMRRSLDCGTTWESPVRILDHHHFPESTLNNFTCIADRETGEVHALFCCRYRRAYHFISRDEGATWCEPVEITGVFEDFRESYDWKLLAVGPGHGIQHSSGRLIVSIWLSKALNFHLPNRAGVLYSDDHGKTWHAGGLPELPPDECSNEGVVVELKDGRVMLNMRQNSPHNRRYVSTSTDGRGNWTPVETDDTLIDPICFASLHRHPGGALLFSNPDSLTRDLQGGWGHACDRQNLTIRASYDDGGNWPVKRTLEPGPSAYSDLATLDDNSILCLYEDGMREKMCDPARLTVARFDLDWLGSREACGPIP